MKKTKQISLVIEISNNNEFEIIDKIKEFLKEKEGIEVVGIHIKNIQK